METDIRIIGIEGNSQRLDGGAMFGNAPKAMWQKLAEPDAQNRILLRCRSLLVQDGSRNVLFETGIGAFFEPALRERYGVEESDHLLLKGLEQAGVGEDDIDVVVLSHLHFDHAGGLLSQWQSNAELRLLFPRARYVLSKPHWDRARHPHPRDKASFIPVLAELLEGSGRLDLVDPHTAHVAAQKIGPWLSFRFSDGHTPGLMLAEIRVGDRKGVYASDLIPGIPWVSASLTMGYDRFAEQVLDEKRSLLEDLAGTDDVVFFTHDAHWPCGTVEKDPATGRFRSKGLSIESWLSSSISG